MKWIFLGTGGGRWNCILQFRRTGGILIQYNNKNIILDPGPGSIVYQREIGFDPRNIHCVMISHNHTDHINDAPVCIEGMTHGCYSKKGVLVAPKSVIEGTEEYSPLSKYHLNACETIIISEPGKTFKLFGIEITPTPTEHNEPYGVGYIFKTPEIKVSYIGDTAYFEGLEKYHKDSDVLIFNLISFEEKKIDATSLHTVYSLLEHCHPKLILLTHFGLKIIVRKMERKLSRMIYEKFGINTFVVYDFDYYIFGKKITYGKAKNN